MNSTDIIIIGAGACGLYAARELLKLNKKVIILEARSRIGGRINTLKDEHFSFPIETGAEFVHGNLSLTKALLKEANISFSSIKGKTYQVKKGKFFKSDFFINDFDKLISKLNQLEYDIPFSEFLNKYFPDKHYESLRESVIRFAEGYDASDINRVSSFSLRDEWSGDDDSSQYRINGGYSRLIEFLSKDVIKHGGIIHLSTPVNEIRWQKNHAEVICGQSKSFTAGKVIITVPLGVLLSESGSKGFIKFSPEVLELRNSFNKIGFGTVIKFFLEFKEPFWEEIMQGLDFLFTDAAIPTWWTQAPYSLPLLTGWIAGPGADRLSSMNDDDLISMGLDSLAYSFGTNNVFLQELLIAKKAVNWKTDPFAYGAYAYSTVESKEAKYILNQPIQDTLYFAGEALYEGQALGTVEAALISAINVIKKLKII